MSGLRSFCRITDQGVWVDGRPIARFGKADPTDNLINFYKKMGVEYPKFYKMDLLSKASLLAVELLKEAFSPIAECADEAVGLLFANSETSSATDLKFRDSYLNEGLPGPSLFVYTLPNIAMGEIAIRNKWYGTQMFAVFPNFAPAYFADYGALMLHGGSAYVVGGWVNVREGLNVLSFVADGVMAVEKPAFCAQLEEIYNSTNSKP